MNIFRIAIELFSLYLLYKLIFDVVIPIAKGSSQIKEQLREMQKKNQQSKSQSQENQSFKGNSNLGSKKSSSNEDYIDFEEIK
jgi:hypothetical protein